jgi:hypothetical protein
MKTVVSIVVAGCILTSCGSNTDKQAQLNAQQRTVDSLKTEMVKKQTIDSMNAALVAQQQQAAINSEQQKVVSSHHASHAAPVHNSYSTSNTYYGSAPTSAPTAAPEQKEKKGWSAKAKGALIGTGVGAITGAMVDKKKGEGAVVGGLAGAAAGLGAGAIIDKKNKDKDK